MAIGTPEGGDFVMDCLLLFVIRLCSARDVTTRWRRNLSSGGGDGRASADDVQKIKILVCTSRAVTTMGTRSTPT